MELRLFPMFEQSVETMEREAIDAALCEKIKRFTWYIEATGIGKDEKPKNSYFTGFSVENGLIMTCAHGLTNIARNLQIQARRLSEEKLSYRVELGDGFKQVTLVNKVPELDLALLKLVDSDNNQSTAEFGDGELQVGQRVVHVGNLEGVFCASYLSGYVAFGCTGNVTLPTDNRRCCNFDIRTLGRRLPYRILGNICNNQFGWKDDDENTDGAKNMHPFIPIIQVNRMQGGRGCSGGPLCDTQGKVMGLVIRRDTYLIAIHVSMVKEFLRRELLKLGACSQ